MTMTTAMTMTVAVTVTVMISMVCVGVSAATTMTSPPPTPTPAPAAPPGHAAGDRRVRFYSHLYHGHDGNHGHEQQGQGRDREASTAAAPSPPSSRPSTPSTSRRPGQRPPRSVAHFVNAWLVTADLDEYFNELGGVKNNPHAHLAGNGRSRRIHRTFGLRGIMADLSSDLSVEYIAHHTRQGRRGWGDALFMHYGQLLYWVWPY